MAVDGVKATKVPKKLLDRMRTERQRARRSHISASDWHGEYGYGAGRAHPCVEFATCPHCHQPAGKLCIGARGPHLGCHFARANVYREMKRVARAELERG